MGRGAQRLAGFGVHVLTGGGAVLGLLALDAVAGGRIRVALLLMFAATVVDGLDGTLARWLRVRERLPSIDGDLLDNIVDFLNYAIVPAFLIHRTDLLPPDLSLAAAAGIAIASAFQFSHRDAKSAERGFRGFPSYWNVVALYLLLGGWPSWVNLTIVAALVVLSFAPVYWVYPSRATRLRGPTLVLTGVWGLLLAVMLALYPEVPRWMTFFSLAYVVYYCVLSALGPRSKKNEMGVRS